VIENTSMPASLTGDGVLLRYPFCTTIFSADIAGIENVVVAAAKSPNDANDIFRKLLLNQFFFMDSSSKRSPRSWFCALGAMCDDGRIPVQ
jgi:hypothetical protein